MNGNISPDFAKETVLKAIQESGIDPSEFVRLGQMAEQVVGNRQLYPMLIQEMIRSGAMQPSDDTGEMNYQLIVSLIALGRVSNELMQGAA